MYLFIYKRKHEHFQILFKTALNLNILVSINLNLYTIHKYILINEEVYSKKRMCILVLKHCQNIYSF